MSAIRSHGDTALLRSRVSLARLARCWSTRESLALRRLGGGGAEPRGDVTHLGEAIALRDEPRSGLSLSMSVLG